MATVKEVAARAGVSPSTVSNVFGGKVPVREQTKRRVLSAARRLGYQPDGLAQALRTGRTRLLGLLVPRVTNPTIAAIVNGATRFAQEAGYAVSVCAIEDELRLQETYLELLRRERAAAVVSQPAGHDPEPYLALRRAGAALVFVDRRPEGVPADFLTPDYRPAVREAVRHLIASGRRRIALLAGPRWIDSTRERVAGFEEAHAEVGLQVDPDLMVTPERRRPGTHREAMEALLRRPVGQRPDAIIAGSADVTLTVLERLHVAGVNVPGEIAVVGTGQVAWAALASPPLSMMEVDGDALGREAVRLALARVEEVAQGDEPAPFQDVRLPVRFVVRASSG
jgi:LacI family transcriptional regulator